MLTSQKVRAVIESELAQYAPDVDVARTVDSLSVGLTLLRNLLLSRIHEDVERHVGFDSMIAPVSARLRRRP